MEGKITIKTHDGAFHADEVTAIAIIKLWHNDLPVEIVRSRERSMFTDVYTYVVDVGGEYDGVSLFDHHQRDFDMERGNGNPYASAGLLWKFLGKGILRRIAAERELKWLDIHKLFDSVDRIFIEPIDLVDCKGPEAGLGIYNKVVQMLNYSDDGFNKAIDLMSDMLMAYIDNGIERARTRLVMNQAFRHRIEMPNGKELHLVHLDEELPFNEYLQMHPELDGVIWKDKGRWRYQVSPLTPTSRYLHEDLRGLEHDDLPEGGIFVHHNGFTCGAETLESLITLITYDGDTKKEAL